MPKGIYKHTSEQGQKAVKTRIKNGNIKCPGSGYKSTETKRRNGIHIGCNSEQAKRGEETSRKNGTDKGYKIQDTSNYKGSTSESALKAWETRRKNDPNNKFVKKQVETRIKNGTFNRYGQSKAATQILDSIEISECIKLRREFPILDDEYGLKFYDALVIGTKNLIEVDGSYWHSKPKVIENDRIKDLMAVKHGYTLYRIAI